MNLAQLQKEGKLVVIEARELDNMLQERALEMYRASGKGLMTYARARDVLQCSARTFQSLLSDPNTKLRKSVLSGRVSAASVYEEVDRLINPANS